jgi:hypothetical protein
MAITIRGSVIKAPDSSPGILFVNGQQKTFVLQDIWQSPIAPTPNLTVDVDLNESGEVVGIRAIPESQLAKEQTTVLLDTASQKGKAISALALERVGKPALIALGLLIIGWFFLDFVSLQIPVFFGAGIKLHASYWQVLGWLHYAQDAVSNPAELLSGLKEGNPGSGIYGLLGIVALAGPLLPVVWKDKRSIFGGLLPLLFMLLIAYQGYRVVSDAMEATGLSHATHTPAQSEAASRELSKLYSIGFGCYLSILSVLFLAGNSIFKFLAKKGSHAAIHPAVFSSVSVPVPPVQPITRPVAATPAIFSCRYCAVQIEPGSRFCDSCGKPQL